PAELQGLRQTIYHVQGLAAIGSRQRLQQFLDLVWSNRQTIRGPREVYRLYSRVAGNAALTRAEAAYLGDIAALARSGAAGAVSHIQQLTPRVAGDQISAEVAQAAASAGSLPRLRSRFFFFFRAGTIRNSQVIVPVGERIYLNVVADHATEVLDS